MASDQQEPIGSTAELIELIREARTLRGWSQQRLAAEAGYSGNMVRFLEIGQTGSPTFDSVLRLTQALGITLVARWDPQELRTAAATSTLRKGGRPRDRTPGDVLLSGAELRQRRIQAGLTQLALAELAGFRGSYVSQLESGKRPVTRHADRQFRRALGLRLPLLGQPAVGRALSLNPAKPTQPRGEEE
jgi:transcriptional regulator with XRE-family HTH domain